ncbi:ATP-binding cassette domain-containing protein [Curtobacterium flaccumfaciens pv. flaccumfaciens]|nr:ATP-binding cassette domain-containing protein [Curtobacterium flaccumfaciens pv. flaccumfaciens]MBO9056013.1 ATP-binding cassette domain-containing protein [Curtobacterium flaccumfaciens pv. flaccumfaciens]QTR91723.1 ATP-binding cassette domain-containing protein [Curtobacterium flaccumfaciens pv. flaccumfaciens]QVG67027.1 ATP-binding cassette domain-containing protein [Curtobacterium flaccumfaciens pv. flaccumfaciens]
MTVPAPSATSPSTGGDAGAGAGVRGARIVFRGWGWRYPERDAWAVRDVDLTVSPGERVAVVGPSGAGKSTLLRAVAGVLPDEPDASDDTAASVQGTLLVDEADPRAVRGRVGLVMQDPEAHTVMSRVGDDVAFGCENAGVPRDETWDRVRTALDVVGLDLPLDRSTAQLSGGQRQRLALAGVLAMRPGALVLDEPCANLDPDGVAQVHDAVRALLDETGATLLVVEHRIGTWLDLVDRLVLLEPGGGVVADGPPARVLADHGEALTAAGVWVPGAEPGRGSARRLQRARGRAGEIPGASGGATAAFRPLGEGASEGAREMTSRGRAGEMPGASGGATAAFRPLGEGTAGEGGGEGERDQGTAVLLEARGLGTARGKQAVGNGIDLGLRAGQVLAVTGPNGVGKSTLGLTLAGLLPPAAGELHATDALADGIGTAPHAWTSRELAARIGTVFQDPEHQFVARSVREEIEAGPRALDAPDAAERATALLDEFGLAHLADANPFTLSGGEQRRLAIASVIAARPPVVVLDEPTSGQDRATWQAVVGRLGALADAGTAVVAVTHDRDLVRALDADEVVLGPDGARPVGSNQGPSDATAPETGPTAGSRPGPPDRTVTADRTADRTDAADEADGTDRTNPVRRPLPARATGIPGVQPVASLIGVLALGVCLVLSLDVVSAAVALALELALLPLLRLPVRTLLLRLAPVLLAVPLTAVSIALYGRPSGREWFDLGFAHVTDGSLTLALATALRVLAVGVPAIALFVRVDPTDLADGLAQVLRLPARFVLGALAAVRMMTLLVDDWRQLAMARRARGLADSGRLRRGATMAFALLVLALRRATTLAVAMESRGFGAPGRRTWARVARFAGPEWAMVAALVGIGVVSIAVAVSVGTWRA